MEIITKARHGKKNPPHFPLAKRAQTLLEDPWPESATEAFLIQQELRQQVRIVKNICRFRIIAGIDVSHDLRRHSHCAIVLMDIDSLKPLESVRISSPTRFPYIPGLLSFREIPVILLGLSKLTLRPDILMLDGQGIAHPRRLGIAAHLGVLLDMPAIGVAKSRLTGKYSEPAAAKGSATPLISGKDRIGTVLRSKKKCNPLFISPGHKIDLDQSLAVTIQCLTHYRLPEPTRLADKLSKQKQAKTISSQETKSALARL